VVAHIDAWEDTRRSKPKPKQPPPELRGAVSYGSLLLALLVRQRKN